MTASTEPARLRRWADNLQPAIERYFAPRAENTPKRFNQAVMGRIKGEHLRRVQACLRRLAVALELGRLPPALQGLSKAVVITMLQTRIDCSGPWTVRDTGDYYDQSAQAVALRDFLASVRTEADKALEESQQRQQSIAELENKIRFAPLAGFYPSTPAIAAAVRELAALPPWPIKILEPSAGRGDLADAVLQIPGNPGHNKVYCCEIQPALQDILQAKGYPLLGGNFLAVPIPAAAEAFDLVIANPPFERGQDAEHVCRAYDFLKPSGRLVAIMAEGTFQRSDSRARAFRDWFGAHEGTQQPLPAGCFRDSLRPTGVNACIVTIG
jgi:predicted RNA methylase